MHLSHPSNKANIPSFTGYIARLNPQQHARQTANNPREIAAMQSKSPYMYGCNSSRYIRKMAMKMSKKMSMKKMGMKKLNAFFTLMLAAKKSKAKSFVYNGKTYVGKPHPKLGLIYKKK